MEAKTSKIVLVEQNKFTAMLIVSSVLVSTPCAQILQNDQQAISILNPSSILSYIIYFKNYNFSY